MNMRIAPWRSLLVLIVLLGGLGGLLAGGLFRAVSQEPRLQSEISKRYYRRLEIPARRGIITDRFGSPLAVSAPTYSAYLDPQKFAAHFGEDKEALAAAAIRVAEALDISAEEVAAKIARGGRFVYLRKYLPPDAAAALAKTGLPGVGAEEAQRRFYPGGHLTGHVVGFTDYLDRGQEGVERARQEWLRPHAGSQKVLRTSGGEVLEEYARAGSRDGGDLALALDLRLQYFAAAALSRAVGKHRARAGALVALDAEGGDILAMANYPSFNPNNLGAAAAGARRNRAAVDIFEPGSVMKPIAAALAIERGLIAPETTLKTAKPFRVGNLTVRDKNIREDITVAEMISRSSNKGAVRIAQMLSAEQLWRGLRDFGFGSAPGAGFPGEAAGLLRRFEKWRPVDHATIGYGHGVSASLLQLARAYAVFAADGKLPPVSLARGEGQENKSPKAARQVLSAQTARQVRKMMEAVAGPEGTAPAAQIAGYRVAGKTGTAIKLNAAGEYDRGKNQAIFVGIAPASKPRFVIAVMIDEPQGGHGYGGVVAAPAFAETMARALSLYAVAPDAPDTFNNNNKNNNGGGVLFAAAKAGDV
jgi:cell division protein FtsI (penicillin-binding protein 3)